MFFFCMSRSSTFLSRCSFYLFSGLFLMLHYVTAAAVWSRKRVGRWVEKFSKCCCCHWSEHRGEASDSVCFQNKRLVPSHILPVNFGFYTQLFVVLFNKHVKICMSDNLCIMCVKLFTEKPQKGAIQLTTTRWKIQNSQEGTTINFTWEKDWDILVMSRI